MEKMPPKKRTRSAIEMLAGAKAEPAVEEDVEMEDAPAEAATKRKAPLAKESQRRGSGGRIGKGY